MRRILNSVRGFLTPEKINRQDEFRAQLNENLIHQQCIGLLPDVTNGEKEGTGTASLIPGRVKVDKSTIPNSNFGVFARRDIRKGEVACLYPGEFHPRLPLWTVASPDGVPCVPFMPIKQQYEDNCYVVHLRHCSGYLDGNPTLASVSAAGLLNPAAVGQLINHPPRGTEPNVAPFDFMWSKALQDQGQIMGQGQERHRLLGAFCARLPNVMGTGPWFLEPRAASAGTGGTAGGETFTTHTLEEHFGSPEEVLQVLPGFAFIARVDIEAGAELFFDYELEPRARPDWYHVPTYK